LPRKRTYREQLPNGQGYDLEPKSYWENKTEKNKFFKESDEERRLDKNNLDHYFPDQRGLGSPSKEDDYSEDSYP
jgi:hypothetical protein